MTARKDGPVSPSVKRQLLQKRAIKRLESSLNPKARPLERGQFVYDLC